MSSKNRVIILLIGVTLLFNLAYWTFQKNNIRSGVVYSSDFSSQFSSTSPRAKSKTFTFLQRVDEFNEELSRFRRNLWKKRGEKEWETIGMSLDVAAGVPDHFDTELQRYPHIRTLALPWDLDEDGRSLNSMNLLVQEYYEWTVSEPLCKWIRSPGVIRAKYDVVYNRTCCTNMTQAVKPRNLEYLYLQVKPIEPDKYSLKPDQPFPDYVYTKPPNIVLYIHVAQDAVITHLGDIISKNVKLAPYMCKQGFSTKPPQAFEKAVLKKEVFVISQYWGGGFFHKMLENFPRIAPFLKFLRENKEIFVHVVQNGGVTAEILELLGIGKERLVNGVVRAHVVYVPQGMPCGKTVPQNAQLLTYELGKAFSKTPSNTSKILLGSNLVLIERTGSRRFLEADAIEEKMRAVAKDFKLNLKLFRDKALPSLERTFEMFHEAAVVVAPHGAGLSNVIFSRPGTLVVEGVCNLPHVNLCYSWTSHVLGHRYHGVPSTGGCESHINVSPARLDGVVRELLTLLKVKP